MIINGPPKQLGAGDYIVHIEGPDHIWTCGPVTVEYHRYFGPLFWLFGHYYIPRRYSPWWLLWQLVRRRMMKEDGD